MKWGAPSVARYGEDAGFHPPELHTATSIAMVATNGIDHYDVACGIPGSGRYVGLWAINTDQWTDYSPDWLLTPQNAAQAAYELTRRCDGFGWSPVWQAGLERHWLNHAATAATFAPWGENEHHPNALHVNRHRMAELTAKARARASR